MDIGDMYDDSAKVTQSTNDRKEKETEVRAEVEKFIDEKYGKDTNPVIQSLLHMGILVDMEVLRRLVIEADNNKDIYLYNNKLAALKTYVSLVKDGASIAEKQRKVKAEDDAKDDSYNEVVVTMQR